MYITEFLPGELCVAVQLLAGLTRFRSRHIRIRTAESTRRSNTGIRSSSHRELKRTFEPLGVHYDADDVGTSPVGDFT